MTKSLAINCRPRDTAPISNLGSAWGQPGVNLIIYKDDLRMMAPIFLVSNEGDMSGKKAVKLVQTNNLHYIKNIGAIQ